MVTAALREGRFRLFGWGLMKNSDVENRKVMRGEVRKTWASHSCGVNLVALGVMSISLSGSHRG